MMHNIIKKYLYYRYDGHREQLRPPLGWCNYCDSNFLYKLKYVFFLKPRWMFECKLLKLTKNEHM